MNEPPPIFDDARIAELREESARLRLAPLQDELDQIKREAGRPFRIALWLLLRFRRVIEGKEKA